MKNTLNKFNFILGILSVIISYLPGILIGEFAIIFIKGIGAIFNIVIGFIESIGPFQPVYVRGFVDVVFEAFAFTLMGRSIGVAFIIYIPIILFRKFTKLNINWLPSIIILIPTLIWFGGIRQIERYTELFGGVYFISISTGFILGTFLPLYYAYLFSKKEEKK